MQKSETTEDLRVRRTRKMLQQAMIDLTVERGFSAITVADIAERAMVNRTTFYRHYLDKCDLLAQYMQEVYDLVGSSPHHETAVDGKASVPQGMIKLLDHIRDNRDFYRVMLGAKGDAGFTESLRLNAKRNFASFFVGKDTKSDERTPPVNLRIDYFSYAGIGGIIWWLENDFPCSAEQLAAWLGQLSSARIGLFTLPNGEPT